MSLYLLDLPNWGASSVWMALLTLTFLEIVLGVDNIIFISIASNKIPEKDRAKANNIGLILAMIIRIVLLFFVSALIAMEKPWFSIDTDWLKVGFSGQSLILIAGGIFLLYKAVSEIHHKLEGDDHHGDDKKSTSTLGKAIVQITIINIVFSFDSILTAVGMTNGIHGALIVMIIAVVLSVVIMMLFANPVSKFVNKHPTIQMLGLSFLILIGFLLLIEGAHLAHMEVFHTHVEKVPKGYLYFAIVFSLLVEMLNMRMRRNKPVELNSYTNEAAKKGILS